MYSINSRLYGFSVFSIYLMQICRAFQLSQEADVLINFRDVEINLSRGKEECCKYWYSRKTEYIGMCVGSFESRIGILMLEFFE